VQLWWLRRAAVREQFPPTRHCFVIRNPEMNILINRSEYFEFNEDFVCAFPAKTGVLRDAVTKDRGINNNHISDDDDDAATDLL